MPDELWTEVHDIVQETGIKTIPKKKECKKAKWLSGEALQIAVKKREVKSKREKERYKHLNAEFQRRARKDKKAFLSKQCKEIEKNNRMGKTRDLCKEISDTRGTFHAKMGTMRGSFVAQLVKNPPAMWETWVQSLGWEDPLEKRKTTHSNIPKSWT